MRTFLVGATAAIALALGAAANDASAYWVIRTFQQWDPFVGSYVTVQQRVWVPDPVYVPAPVVVPLPVYRVGPGFVRPVPTISAGWYNTRPLPPGWISIGFRF